ncbi:MAG: Gfo/Idh/MocA family oxidoreductase [Pseudohongiellaceae bacterium]|nr:Gfo/Idh/MocA family oxidoreductase [Pseudohongiellaceae bacterium]
MSEGNGHPYSWSAIFNGYNPDLMENCGFPVIPRYLEQHKWPESRIPTARVEAVWTQDLELSRKIAQTCLIPNIASSIPELIADVDAVLLARDDAENHLYFAKQVLQAGKPIYIDKPIAHTLDSMREIYAFQKYSGQIFTCSALRFSPELKLTESDKSKIGDIRRIIATTPKSWDKYAIHIIEPVINLLTAYDTPSSFISSSSSIDDSSRSLHVNWASGITTDFYAMGASVTPISIRVYGSKACKELIFSDSFTAFKAALWKFVSGVKSKTIESTESYNERVVQILEKGRV